MIDKTDYSQLKQSVQESKGKTKIPTIKKKPQKCCYCSYFETQFLEVRKGFSLKEGALGECSIKKKSTRSMFTCLSFKKKNYNK